MGALKTIKQAELASLEIAPRKKLLGEWMTERHPCMVYAQTGRGKSLFSMSIAIAVAGGGKVFGWEAPQPRPVLYIDAEMDIADAKERNHLLVPAVEDLDAKALGDNLILLSRHRQDDDVVFPDLVDPKGQAALLEEVALIKPALVILDNLSTLADIRDENDAAAFTPVLAMLWKLRQAGCAVLLVHHTGKQEGKFRGSSKLAATFESILQLAPNNDLFDGDTGFTMQVDKYRGGNAPSPMKLQLVIDKDNGGGQWIVEGDEKRQLQELVAAVQSREFGYAKEVAASLGLSQGEVSKRKRRALKQGLITGEAWDACLREGRSIGGN